MIELASSVGRARYYTLVFGIITVCVNFVSHFVWYLTRYAALIQYVGLALLFFLIITSIIFLFKLYITDFFVALIPILVTCIFSSAGYFNVLTCKDLYIDLHRDSDCENRCHDQAIYLEGMQQYDGICQIFIRDFSRGADYIMYDTTGQIMLAIAKRDHTWNEAVSKVPNGRTIISEDLSRRRICGPYYDITINIEDVDKY